MKLIKTHLIKVVEHPIFLIYLIIFKVLSGKNVRHPTIIDVFEKLLQFVKEDSKR